MSVFPSRSLYAAQAPCTCHGRRGDLQITSGVRFVVHLSSLDGGSLVVDVFVVALVSAGNEARSDLRDCRVGDFVAYPSICAV